MNSSVSRALHGWLVFIAAAAAARADSNDVWNRMNSERAAFYRRDMERQSRDATSNLNAIRQIPRSYSSGRGVFGLSQSEIDAAAARPPPPPARPVRPFQFEMTPEQWKEVQRDQERRSLKRDIEASLAGALRVADFAAFFGDKNLAMEALDKWKGSPAITHRLAIASLTGELNRGYYPEWVTSEQVETGSSRNYIQGPPVNMRLADSPQNKGSHTPVAVDIKHGMELLESAAKAGYVPSMLTLARLSELGTIVPKDRAVFLRWNIEAIRLGYAEGAMAIVRASESGSFGAKQPEVGYAWRLVAATLLERSEDWEGAIKAVADVVKVIPANKLGAAMAVLGIGYASPEKSGLPPDKVKAFEWRALSAALLNGGDLPPAAEKAKAQLAPQELAKAWTETGTALASGYFGYVQIGKNIAIARDYLKSGARLGSAEAAYQLGEIEARARNKPVAYAWYVVASILPGDGSRDYASLVQRTSGTQEAMDKAAIECSAARIIEDDLAGVGVEPKAIVALYRSAADAGNPDALYRLAQITEEGIGMPANRAEALTLYKKAVARGSDDAAFALGSLDKNGEERTTGLIRNLMLVLPRAFRNLPDAQVRIAEIYEEGGDSPENLIAAYRWYLLAGTHRGTKALILDKIAALEKRLTREQQAEALLQVAKERVESAYTTWTGEIRFWFATAANAGSAEAMFWDGRLTFETGLGSDGLETNCGKGLEHIRKSAALGWRPAQEYLGKLHETGREGLPFAEGSTVTSDPVEAATWYWAAAVPREELVRRLDAAQRRSALERLARRYEAGTELPRDRVRAAALWRLIAILDDGKGAAVNERDRLITALPLPDRSSALAEFGRILRDGAYGEPVNEPAGWEWIAKGAEQGCAWAQCQMGRRALDLDEMKTDPFEGRDPPVTHEAVAESGKWLLAGASQHHPESLYRLGLLDLRLTHLQISLSRDQAPHEEFIYFDLPTNRELGLVPADTPESEADEHATYFQLLRAAARLGNPDAQLALTKSGSEDERLQWLRRLARAGDVNARAELMRWYRGMGHGDFPRSLAWSLLVEDVDPAVLTEIEKKFTERILRGRGKMLLAELKITRLALLD